MAKEKRYYWLKFKRDFFDDLRIRKLQGIPGGDTYVLTYIKILTYSINTSGIIVYQGIFETIEEEIALEIREDPKTIRFVLEYASNHGMLEGMEEQGKFYLPYVAENTGSEGASAQRMRKLRDKKSNLKELPPSHCDDTVTERDKNVTLETETELDTETHTDTEIEKNPLFKKWLEQYCSKPNVINPLAYKADMRKKILNKDDDAIKAFLKWEKDHLVAVQKSEYEKKVKSFDYSSLIGFELGENKTIERVVDYDPNGSMIHIYFSDGTNDPSLSKVDLYSWYQSKMEETA
jgi:predicted phage replisome organizer